MYVLELKSAKKHCFKNEVFMRLFIGERNCFMIVNLFEADKMFSVVLPQKPVGQFWLSDDDGTEKKKNIASIESIDNNWYLLGNKNITLFQTDGSEAEKIQLKVNSFFFIKKSDSLEKHLILIEDNDLCGQPLGKKE